MPELSLDSMGPDQILSILRRGLRSNVEEVDEGWRFSSGYSMNASENMLSKEEMDILLAEVTGLSLDNGARVTRTEAEVIVRLEAPSRARAFADESEHEVDDPEALVTYRIGAPTPAYALVIGLNFKRARIRSPYFSGGVRPPRELDYLSVPEAFAKASRLTSVRLTFASPMSQERALALIDSFLFSLSYNTGVAHVRVRDLDSLGLRHRATLFRRARLQDIDPPRRIVNGELLAHYQQALASDSPVLAYLSFYHVLEHWFSDVYLDKTAKKVQERITSPAFSYRSKADMFSLVELISRDVTARKDEISFDERVALHLVLAKYLQMSDLVTSINDLEPDLIPLYGSVQEFSGGKAIDFSASKSTVLKQLTHRVYETRNALVHRKSRRESIYRSFVDDASLRRELPLLQFLAEQVIIASGELLK